MTKVRHLAFPLLLLLALPVLADKPTAPASVPGARQLNAEQVVELIQGTPNLVVIDARRGEEHAKGHIEGAVSLIDTDITETTLGQHIPGKDTPVLFYCNGERCLRSSNAARKAVEWGYRRVYWFRGGWEEWVAKELPVSK